VSIQAARLSALELEQAESEITTRIEAAFTRAYADPFPTLE
jgi:hypothetical protein